MARESLKADLAFIKAHLSFLPRFITMLEEQGMELTKAVDLMESARAKLDKIPGEVGKELKAKLDSIVEKNPGYKTVKTIAGVLSGTSSAFPESMSPGDITTFKYCPGALVHSVQEHPE